MCDTINNLVMDSPSVLQEMLRQGLIDVVVNFSLRGDFSVRKLAVATLTSCISVASDEVSCWG